MRVPPALLPLRHRVFRWLWTANVVTALGTWMQNTGAGWLMTSLSQDALSVSLVQAATILPTFLLALPAGALADIVDRRWFMTAVQVWTMLAAAVLTALTLAGMIGATGLIALTFAIGIGSAMYQPAWGATVPEVVPRRDLVPAIALNGIGFNLARALGPAIGGLLVVFGGPAFNFALFTASFVASIAVLVGWRRRERRSALPREQLVAAMRVGMRFVRHSPAMRAAMIRAAAYFFPAAAPWALLPLVVREHLGLGAGSFGALLGLMGVGGVTAGMLLPMLRGHHAKRSYVMLGASALSCAGIAMIASTHHWSTAAIGMVLFGLGWVSASSTAQAAAQLVAPPWVRARSLAIYQLAFNGALVAGTFFWGAIGSAYGIQASLLAAAISGIVLAALARPYSLDQAMAARSAVVDTSPEPEAPAPELALVLPQARGRILETIRYKVPSDRRDAFLAVMVEVRRVRGRAGAELWQLCEDVAHPEGWVELWTMHDWADHLREQARLSESDLHILAQAALFRDEAAPIPSRFLSVEPA